MQGPANFFIGKLIIDRGLETETALEYIDCSDSLQKPGTPVFHSMIFIRKSIERNT